MSREIKFRFWHSEYDCMLYTYGSQLKYNLEGYNQCLEKHLNYKKSVIPLQYIGITDFFGKPIYEGDYLLLGESKDLCEVVWKDEQCRFGVNFLKLNNIPKYIEDFDITQQLLVESNEFYFGYVDLYLEVIGNKFESNISDLLS